MSNIFVNVTGNGYAYVTNPTPSDGDIVTLYATPDTGETLDDIIAIDSGGHSIALAVTQSQTFIYRAAWGDVSITVVFSGSTPPTPTYLPAWLIAVIKKAKERSKKL